jgi:hypothetical protein
MNQKTNEPSPDPIPNPNLEQETRVNSRGMVCYRGRWGWHACSFDEYLALKALHREVWEAFFDYVRGTGEMVIQDNPWRRPPFAFFPHYHKEPGPDGPVYKRYTPGYRMSEDAARVVDGFRRARRVYADPEEVEPFTFKYPERSQILRS